MESPTPGPAAAGVAADGVAALTEALQQVLRLSPRLPEVGLATVAPALPPAAAPPSGLPARPSGVFSDILSRSRPPQALRGAALREEACPSRSPALPGPCRLV